MFGRKKIKELEAKLEVEKANNLILLENAEELRAKIKELEQNQPKKKGRKKKEPTENN